jgi:cytochrome c-type biogenesis protein CcmH
VRAAALTALLVLALAAPALGAVEPRASLPDIEDEVMCVECGTPLAVSDSPVANQERAFIRREIAQGKTKAQIKADMVAQYGQDVLADPHRHGFGKALWIVPVALVLLGGAVIVTALRRWRRNGPAPAAAAPPELSPEDARRLDAELSR